MSDAVRAAVLVAPGRYQVQEFPRPSLDDGSLLMQVEMSGICGTDKHTFLGETKQYAGTPAETETPFPIIQGHPAVNQIELHPYFTQPDVQAADAQHGILTQAWSPIGGITFYPGWGQERRNVMEDPTIAAIGQLHSKTPAQVMLRWHLQQGRSAIPKSTNPARIAENFDVFNFELSADELAAIDALDTGMRNGPDPDEAREERFAMVIPEA